MGADVAHEIAQAQHNAVISKLDHRHRYLATIAGNREIDTSEALNNLVLANSNSTGWLDFEPGNAGHGFEMLSCRCLFKVLTNRTINLYYF